MDKAKPRWGIFAVAALMCLSNLFAGGKVAYYVFIWGRIAYIAFRGDLDQVALELKVLIVFNVVLAVPIFLLVGDSSELWRWISGVETKNTVFFGFLISLAIKVGMLTYVNGQRKAVGRIKSAGALSDVAVASSKESGQMNMPIQKSNIAQEDAWYEQALDELNSGETVKAIWARAMVEGAGDDAKTKAAYIRLRLVQLQSTYQGIPIAAPSSGEPAINVDVTVSDDADRDAGKKFQKLEEATLNEVRREKPVNWVAIILFAIVVAMLGVSFFKDLYDRR